MACWRRRGGWRHHTSAARTALLSATVCAVALGGFLLAGPASPAAATSVPTVSAVAPDYGPSSGGNTIDLTGSGFTGATSVLFGSTPATQFKVISDTAITATAPGGTTTAPITVAGPGGRSSTTPADNYTYTYTSGGYSATITTSSTSSTTGQYVTLTATANQDVWPTPYGMSIYDITTGTVTAHTGGNPAGNANTTLSITVTQSAATTQQYVARIDNAAGTAIASVSDPVTVTWRAGTSGGGTTPPPIQENPGFPVTNEATALSSLTVAPAHVGDVMIVSIQEHLTSLRVASLSGGGVGTWQRALGYSDPNRPLHFEVWYGTVTAPGPATVTATYGTYSPTLSIEMVADSFTPSTPTGSWALVAGEGSANTGSAVAWPALMSGTGQRQLYWGSSEEATSGYAGSTPGFVYADTRAWNSLAYDDHLSPGVLYAPGSVVSPPAAWTAAAVILSFS